MKVQSPELIKVFLVEDEFVIRKGIRRSINWEAEGYRFVGEASDGELAYPMIIEEKPDILITDIKMPFMDGLELSRMVKKVLPNIKILILSGYDEFNYAKEAIKIGVTEYLLKPVSATQLLEVLEDISDIIRQERQEISANSLIRIGASREKIEKFLNNGTLDEVTDFTESYIDKIEVEDLRSLTYRQYIILDLYMIIMAFYKKLDVPYEQLQMKIDDMQNDTNKFISIGEMKNHINHLLIKAIETRDKISESKYQDIIELAKEIIKDTYMTNDISLNSVAATVGLSSSYFSAVFSREIGKTFKEYLTEIRMEKAKELLMCSSMQTAEIGYAVGYKDPHYFSFMFKKKQGCSPKEYRDRRKD